MASVERQPMDSRVRTQASDNFQRAVTVCPEMQSSIPTPELPSRHFA
ncbi:MAG: hypothetical protein JWM11_1725 [Planctomycetaceae bacterium]|nr:hypothetical protein [Planctomycetaceae bacterium]